MLTWHWLIWTSTFTSAMNLFLTWVQLEVWKKLPSPWHGIILLRDFRLEKVISRGTQNILEKMEIMYKISSAVQFWIGDLGKDRWVEFVGQYFRIVILMLVYYSLSFQQAIDWTTFQEKSPEIHFKRYEFIEYFSHTLSSRNGTNSFTDWEMAALSSTRPHTSQLLQRGSLQRVVLYRRWRHNLDPQRRENCGRFWWPNWPRIGGTFCIFRRSGIPHVQYLWCTFLCIVRPRYAMAQIGIEPAGTFRNTPWNLVISVLQWKKDKTNNAGWLLDFLQRDVAHATMQEYEEVWQTLHSGKLVLIVAEMNDISRRLGRRKGQCLTIWEILEKIHGRESIRIAFRIFPDGKIYPANSFYKYVIIDYTKWKISTCQKTQTDSICQKKPNHWMVWIVDELSSNWNDFCLQIYRDYVATGDTKFLNDMWPVVKLTMEYASQVKYFRRQHLTKLVVRFRWRWGHR